LTIEVQVRDNNVEAAIRVLKKKLLREGIFKELKLRKHYENRIFLISVTERKLYYEESQSFSFDCDFGINCCSLWWL
jgi:hypothetical protein